MTRSFAFADLWELVSEQVPDREAVVCRDRRLTYGDLDERANRLAAHLRANGVGPGDHLGVYLTNGTEYLETMLAAMTLRAVPINVNYRYVEDELRYLFADAGVRAVVHDAEFADRMAAVRDDLPELAVALAVGEDYEAALAAADPAPAFEDRSSDDLYILYTGGTTGMPKGVLWRQADIYVGARGPQPGPRVRVDERRRDRRGRPQRGRPAPAGTPLHARRRPLAGPERHERRPGLRRAQRLAPAQRARASEHHRLQPDRAVGRSHFRSDHGGLELRRLLDVDIVGR